MDTPGKTQAANEAAKKARLADYNRRIGEARTDRSRYAGRINSVYDFAQPDRMRIDQDSETPVPPDLQDEIYDEILQDAVEDFASDMVDLFTPKYRPWTAFKPKETLTTGEQHEIAKALVLYGSTIFTAIKESNFYAQMQDVWVDIAAAAGGICIPYPGPNRKTVCHHVPLAQLLFDEGPEGIDGRWWPQSVRIRHLKATFPGVDWEPILKKYPGDASKDRKIVVTQGAVRDWDRLDEEVWLWHIIADNELVHEETFVGEGSCPLIVTRWRRSAPSAWGLGPAARALAPTRTVNKLALEILTIVEKTANPPHSYEEDTVQNYEQGVDAGSFVPRMPGSKSPEAMFRPEGQAQIAYFEQEDLRQRVRRALFQDKPIQRGDTPPTLGQWLDEKTTNNRRMENPRDRIVTEGVMQWIKRFKWIEEQAGRLQPVKLEGDIVEVEIQSPLSKASDMEDVSIASQVLQIGAAYLGPEMQFAVDGVETLRRIKEKMNDNLVAVRTEEERAQEIALRSQGVGEAGGQQAAGNVPAA